MFGIRSSMHVQMTAVDTVNIDDFHSYDMEHRGHSSYILNIQESTKEILSEVMEYLADSTNQVQEIQDTLK